jgi:hypothetical protein
MFWEYMLRGLCHGGYVIGLVAALGVAAGLMALFCILMSIAFGEEDKEDKP